ncbi:hypothetical protein C8J57DRAFT_1302439 [Mycena rebaudengoi]|nr:hypothetical protein C8J57DRAFT_1302439 [Mycena rebaudengoi]
MFFAPLARPLACRLAASRLPLRVSARSCLGYSTAPPVDRELRNFIQAERDSESDASVRDELETFLNAPPPPLPESARSTLALELDDLEDDLDDEDLTRREPVRHASILEPERVATTSKELFGTNEKHASRHLNPKDLPFPGPLPEEFTELEYATTVVHGRSLHRPFRHPRTHALPVAQIQFLSHETTLLALFVHFAAHAAYSLGMPCSRMYTLPTKRTLWTVLRGPFVHKKSQENFERKVHRRGLMVWDADSEVVERWFKYLRRHAMGGVGMRCVKWERMPIGIGQKTEIEVEDALHRSKQISNSVKIKRLGARIVEKEAAAVEKTVTAEQT